MPCPDDDEIADFASRGLRADSAAAIEAHVADCDACRKLVFALGGDEPAESTQRAVIGRFELLDVIGNGSMGIVYRARDPELDRLVALKLRRSRARLDVEGEDRLRREAQALARLAHPNVVAVHEIGSHGGARFVAMEYVDGVTLEDWLATARPPADVLRLLTDAGRGLAAAHAVGLIHRDVKPRNIFVSAAGVAKIGDFGLARVDRAGSGVDADSELAITLSVTGSIVGTPAYMAPEQLRGEVATEASDQFGFCVTLYEALYGKRPFDGATIRDLLTAMTHEPAIPATPRVSSRIVRVLARGLAHDPRRRFASMTALLDGLSPRSMTRRWLVLGGAALAAGAVAITAIAGERHGHEVSPCSGAELHVREVWSEPRSTAVQRAFAATNLPYGDQVFRDVRTSLDRYASQWADAHRRACEAGQRAEGSIELLDRRMQCLDHRLDDLRALAGVLAAADASVVRRATRAVVSLPAIERCLDRDVMMAAVDPPDPAQRAEVESLRDVLAAVRADLGTGRYATALESVQPLVERARRAGYTPVLAEVLLELGRARTETEHAAEAELVLQEAARTAYAAGHDEVAARAWIALVYTAGSQRNDVKAGQTAAEMARAALARVPASDPMLRVQILSYEGVLRHTNGDYAAALDKHREALALATELLPDGHDALATVRNNLANTLMRLGHRDEAIVRLREAVSLRERGLGAGHPDTETNRANLALQLGAAGRHAEALVDFDRAIAALERGVGPDHPLLATALANSCTTLQALGRIDEALERARRAAVIFEASSGPTHPTTATALTQVAVLLVASERASEALPLYERALAIQEASLRAEHPNLATTLNNLGFALLDARQPDAAIARFERALAIIENQLGRDHHRIAYSVVGLGRAHLARGNAVRAIAELQRGVAVLEAHDAPVAELDEARRWLAQALSRRRSTRP